MAFQQKEWKNRLSEHPTRRLLTPTDGSEAFEVEVTREEGTIMQQGDAFNAANMNDLERRIAEGIGGGDENMAPIEEGPESENAYAVGQLLIYEGQLYRVTSAIAVGNTLVENVNIKSTTLGNELVGELTANGHRLYMDYKDGKYGYNTSPTRGADTFTPFNTSTAILIGSGSGRGTATFDVTEKYPYYSELTISNFRIACSGAGSRVYPGNYYDTYYHSASYTPTYNPQTGQVQVAGSMDDWCWMGGYELWLVIPET